MRNAIEFERGMAKGCLMLLGVFALLIMTGGWAMDTADIPADAPNDAVMATPNEVQRTQDWAKSVFTGERSTEATSAIPLEVRRQDYNVLRFGQSCMETPVQIGKQAFTHGLGTHANSEILVQIPSGAKQFKAFAGIDNNYDTQGTRGSAVFSVEIDGKELCRTPTLCGGNEPHAVSIDIPADAKELVLKVDTTPDGPAYDQSDWADAQFVFGDGHVAYLDDGQYVPFLSEERVPFSFQYNGAASVDILKDWKRETKTKELDEAVLYTIRWTDPATSLAVIADVRCFTRYPAIDWVLHFENQGKHDMCLYVILMGNWIYISGIFLNTENGMIYRLFQVTYQILWIL